MSEEKCCCCFDIKCGLKTLAVLIALGAISEIYKAVTYLVNDNFIFMAICMIVQTLPDFYVIYRSFKTFVQDDNIVNRGFLALSYNIMLYYRLAYNILMTFLIVIIFEVYFRDPKWLHMWKEKTQ